VRLTKCSHVQTQLRDLHREQHQDVAELLQELKQLLISARDPNVDYPTQRIERDLDVPSELCVKFAAELKQRLVANNQGSDPADVETTLSVKDGLEAFFTHFNEVHNHIDPLLTLLK
jgi:hypothetical protein